MRSPYQEFLREWERRSGKVPPLAGSQLFLCSPTGDAVLTTIHSVEMLDGGVPTLYINHTLYQGMTLLYLALDAEGNWRAVCDGGYIHRDREKKDEKVKPNVLVTYQMDKRRYKKKLEWHPVDVEILGYVR